MSRLLIWIILLLLTPFFSEAQTNIEGKWVGSYKVLGKYYPIELNIKQAGGVLEVIGTNYMKDSLLVSYKGKGLFRGEGVIIKFDEWIKKEDKACLSTQRLKLLKNGEDMQLVGKWGHNLV